MCGQRTVRREGRVALDGQEGALARRVQLQSCTAGFDLDAPTQLRRGLRRLRHACGERRRRRNHRHLDVDRHEPPGLLHLDLLGMRDPAAHQVRVDTVRHGRGGDRDVGATTVPHERSLEARRGDALAVAAYRLDGLALGKLRPCARASGRNTARQPRGQRRCSVFALPDSLTMRFSCTLDQQRDDG